jgi:hypothetical protein
MRCPVCRADTAGPHCRRCKADLSVLLAVEDQADRALQTARRELARGEWTAASTETDRARTLRADREAEALRATVQLLQRDFSGAWKTYRRLSSAPGTNPPVARTPDPV